MRKRGLLSPSVARLWAYPDEVRPGWMVRGRGAAPAWLVLEVRNGKPHVALLKGRNGFIVKVEA